MRTLDLESAIQEFLQLARTLHARPRLTAEEVLDRFLSFYRDVRVEGTNFEMEQDALVFQWGNMSALMLSEPTDLRSFSDEQLIFDPVERRYIDLARQIFAQGNDESLQFDDIAIDLSLTLVYEPATIKRRHDEFWINEPAEIDSLIKEFQTDPLITSLWSLPATRLIATVGRCG